MSKKIHDLEKQLKMSRLREDKLKKEINNLKEEIEDIKLSPEPIYRTKEIKPTEYEHMDIFDPASKMRQKEKEKKIKDLNRYINKKSKEIAEYYSSAVKRGIMSEQDLEDIVNKSFQDLLDYEEDYSSRHVKPPQIGEGIRRKPIRRRTHEYSNFYDMLVKDYLKRPKFGKPTKEQEMKKRKKLDKEIKKREKKQKKEKEKERKQKELKSKLRKKKVQQKIKQLGRKQTRKSQLVTQGKLLGEMERIIAESRKLPLEDVEEARKKRQLSRSQIQDIVQAERHIGEGIRRYKKRKRQREYNLKDLYEIPSIQGDEILYGITEGLRKGHASKLDEERKKRHEEAKKKLGGRRKVTRKPKRILNKRVLGRIKRIKRLRH